MGFMFCDLHVSLNNLSSGDINSSNLPCFSVCPLKSESRDNSKTIQASLMKLGM